jgi:hypothetical protein
MRDGMSAAGEDGMPKKTDIDPITLDSVHGGFVNRFPVAAAFARPFVRGLGGNVRFWRSGNGFRGQRLFGGGGGGGE